MDLPTILIAALSGMALFQIIGMLSPEERVRGTETPASVTYINAKDISKTTPLRSIKQTEPAKWEIETEAGQRAIVYSKDNPIESVNLNIE